VYRVCVVPDILSKAKPQDRNVESKPEQQYTEQGGADNGNVHGSLPSTMP
jgi:hypothetical protein